MLIKYGCMCGTTHSYYGFKFVKEFTETQSKKIEEVGRSWAISNLDFGSKTLRDFITGLAYTSSGSFAGLWECNTDSKYKWDSHFGFRGFVISEDGFIIAHFCQYDDDKNELDEDMNIIIGRL